MLDTTKLEEINMNYETVNMMKDMNINENDIKNELSTLLDSYDENLIECLIFQLNQPLFQSILLRLKLQSKLKLSDNKLVNSFNDKLQPLIKYLINYKIDTESSLPKRKKVVINESPKKEEDSENNEEISIDNNENENDNSDDNENNNDDENENDNNKLKEYIEECIESDNNSFLELEEVYDDFANDWLESKGENNTLNEEDFTKIFTKNKGKLSTKKGKKGWKNLKIID